eukprot:Transcript_2841.p1 GENE.Transcript_2841~~Transcript_2841.p1  ORF type:complete len:483 (+),score=23.40 Transcript_2841:84-1532(+)
MALPRLRVLWLENRLDCRVWAYYCELRRAFRAMHNVSDWASAHKDRAADPQLIVVGPRFTTNLHTADTALGVSRQRYANVPLVVLQNKMYTSATEFTGNLEAKLEWTRAVGAAAAFTWLTRHEEFTQRSGVRHYRLPFAADAAMYGKFAGNYSSQEWDVGFTGSSSKKYAFRQRVLATLRKMRGIRPFLKSWSQVTASHDDQWNRLSRLGYVKQVASTKIWVSTTGPDWIVGTRYFEVLMSGTTLLLCNRPPANVTTYSGLFEDGVHVVMFDGMADLQSKVRQYLDDEPARRRIVGAAHKLALSTHRWEDRAAFMTRVAHRAIELHPPGTPWFSRPASKPAVALSPPVGCFVEEPSLMERARKGGAATRRRARDNSTRVLVELKRPASHMGPYRHGFGVDDCESACAAYPHYGLLAGGFTSGDAHRRASCYCGRPGVLRALLRHKSPRRCASTCSLRDERPCGGPGAISLYTPPVSTYSVRT